MNADAIRRGQYLINEYYDAEALREMWHDFQELRLPGEEFAAYVAYCYDNEQAEPYLGEWW